MQMRVGDLRSAIKDLPDNLPVYFRRVAPICGNIEEAGKANLDTFSSFGVVSQCLIIEPMKDDDEPVPGCRCGNVREDGRYLLCVKCTNEMYREFIGVPAQQPAADAGAGDFLWAESCMYYPTCKKGACRSSSCDNAQGPGQ